MSIEVNKAGIRRMVEELWNKGNMDVAQELYTPDYILHSVAGQEVRGAENVAKLIATVREAFPDMHMTLDDILAEGDKVAYRMTLTGTHKDEYMGIAPTGKPVKSTAILISRCVDGKEAEAWVMQDRLAMYQQLGTPPPME